MIIRVKNSLADTAQSSFLSNPEASGVSTIRVKNINSFNSNWAVQMGATGEEQSEIKLISASAISGTALSLTANTTYDHPTDTPVFGIKFDQVVFMKSTAGTAGTATVITGGTVNVTPDSLTTEFDDTLGVSADAYKAKFRNSVTGEETSTSGFLTTGGFSFFSKAKIRERIKNKLFSTGFLDADNGQIDDWINEWMEELNNEAIKVDKSYALGTVDVAFGTAGLGTITSSDYKDLKRFWVTYNGTDKFRARKMDLTQVLPQEVFDSSRPIYMWRGDDVFEVKPAQSGGTAELIYYKRHTGLVNDTDELPMSMRSYTNSFVNYGVAEAYYNDQKKADGDRYISRAEAGRKKFIAGITPRSFTGINMINFDYSVAGDEDDFYASGFN